MQLDISPYVFRECFDGHLDTEPEFRKILVPDGQALLVPEETIEACDLWSDWGDILEALVCKASASLHLSPKEVDLIRRDAEIEIWGKGK